MIKPLCLFLFLLLTVAPGAAQQTCHLVLKDAPAISGLKLGMTGQDVRAVFGKELKFKPKKSGEQVFFQNFIKKAPPDFLRGTRALYLRFTKHRLYQIEFFYENRDDWKTLVDFTDSFAATHNFSNLFWQPIKDQTVAKCVDFTVVADQVLNPRVEITDEPNRARLSAELRQKSLKK